MRFFTLPIIWIGLAFAIPLSAQEHLSNTVSVSPATPLNAGGFVVTAQYHLNSFDELRGGIYLYEFRNSEDSGFATSLISIDYAKGFKFKNQRLHRFGYYLGAGWFLGREVALLSIGTSGPEYTVYGLRTFAELEYSLMPQITLISRMGSTIPLSFKASTNLELALGTRLYF
ncbi:MAG: hypothetical protein AAF960_28765 [Bacteroidota bacterium]